MQRVYAEVLRLYVHVIEALNLVAEVIIPDNYDGSNTPQVQLPTGDMVMVPSWTVHRGLSAWFRRIFTVDSAS